MKKTISTLVIGTFAFLSSCSSSDDNKPTPAPAVQTGCKLTKITTAGYTTIGGAPYMETIFTYNEDKMAGFILSYLGNGFTRFELVYENNSDQVKEILVFDGDNQTSSGKYVLEYDSNGHLIKSQTFLGNLPISESIYVYTQNKRTQRRAYYLNEPNYTENYKWQGDNCIEMSYIDHGYSDANFSRSIQYSTADNTLPKYALEFLYIIEADYSMELYEYGSKNLFNQLDNDGDIYTYTFTQKGLVESTYRGDRLEYKFEYTCE